jgi:hypothetical protein
MSGFWNRQRVRRMMKTQNEVIAYTFINHIGLHPFIQKDRGGKRMEWVTKASYKGI